MTRDRSKEMNLYFVRHGETEANLDRSLYERKADHAILLTEKGKDQARAAGQFLADRFAVLAKADPSFGRIRVWHSTYYRARQTTAYIVNKIGKVFSKDSGLLDYRPEPFLVEQKAGLYDGLTDKQFAEKFPNEARDYFKNKEANGEAYSRPPLGDSRMDIVKSFKLFAGSMMRDFETQGINHVVIVCHGVTLRAGVMAWMRYEPEWLQAEENPDNCWIRHIHGNGLTGCVDEGYIYGEGAPLGDPYAKQRQLKKPQDIIMLTPQRPNAITPRGVTTIDPFSPEFE